MRTLHQARSQAAQFFRNRNWKTIGKTILKAGLLIFALGWFGLKLVPLPAELMRAPIQHRELLDRRGRTLREVRVQERFSRELAAVDIPPKVFQAMLAAEDKRFFEHHGIDAVALSRAVWGNLRAGRVTSGASTITEQLVKLAEPRARNWRTKVIEAVTALRLEQLWSKEQILVAYLNRLDFGSLNIGIASAANFYFGKPLADLSDAEAAFLAGLPKNPHRLNPYLAPVAAARRQRLVLQRMHAAGWLGEAELARASAEPVRLLGRHRTFRAPHFVDLVLRDLPKDAPATVQTSLDLELNEFVERTVRERLAGLRGQNVRNAAAVIIENATGQVMAMVGSEDYFAPGSGQVNGAWARRSPGSALKPFTYLLALERGATPASVVADVPAVFATATGIYQPTNYNRRCYGPMRYRLALANSLNIPAIKVLASIGGAPVLAQRLRDWGLTTLNRSDEEYGLGLTLGNAEVRLLELTNAYAALARLGEYRPYSCLGNPQPGSRPVAEATSPAQAEAWLLADMLSDNAARTLAFGSQSALHFDFPVACKTGTSTDFRDNWAMGFTPEFTVGIWVGNFDGQSMAEVSGVTGAGPILHAVFEHLHHHYGTGWYGRPESIVEADIHPLTGHRLAGPRSEKVRERFFRDHLPAFETAADYDALGKVKLGLEYQSWLASAENALPNQVAGDETAGALRLIAPVPGTTLILDPDLPTSARVPLQASGASGLVWQSATLQCQSAEGRSWAALVEGEHRLTVTDPATGRRAETWIRVKAL